jgi:pimeloyl-ACP methyl ester carboxylesterase
MIPLVYLHGLESGPNAGKAMALRNSGHFDVLAPALDSAPMQKLLRSGSFSSSKGSEAMAVPAQQALQAIRVHRPRVIVGSSFGGALLVLLAHQHDLSDITLLLLASAHRQLCGLDSLPAGQRALVVHGRDDDVVPIEDARRLTAACVDTVLIELHDNHRLQGMTESGLLVQLSQLAAARGSR